MACKTQLTLADDRICQIYERVSVPEADCIRLKFHDAKKICIKCPYGNMD